MVVPIPGTGLMGPPPCELEPLFRNIKVTLLITMVSAFGRLLASTVFLGLGAALLDSMNVVVNILVGIFLLRDDPQIGRIHQCLLSTVFQSCAPQCTMGSMQCLMPFIICNLMTLVMALLGGDVSSVLTLASGAAPGLSKASPGVAVVVWLWVLSAVGLLVGQGAGTWYGWQAYKQATEAFSASMPAMQAQGGPGGGFGSYRPPAYQPSAPPPGPGLFAPSAAAPTTAGGRPPAFQPFSGQGQVLGSS